VKIPPIISRIPPTIFIALFIEERADGSVTKLNPRFKKYNPTIKKITNPILPIPLIRKIY
jgi:hypothetical protein